MIITTLITEERSWLRSGRSNVHPPSNYCVNVCVNRSTFQVKLS